MTALRVQSHGKVDQIELPSPPEPEPGYSLVDVRRAGVSMREVAELRSTRPIGTIPRIAGAYGIGRVTNQSDWKARGGVIEAGRLLPFAQAPAHSADGRRVVLPTVRECGSCESCLRGAFHQCDNPIYAGVEGDGYLRATADVPDALLTPVPEGLPDSTALFAASVARCLQVFEEYPLDAGEFVLVVGATVDGLIFSQVAQSKKVRPILIDTGTARLEIAKDLGIEHRLNPYACHAPDEIEWITGDQLVSTAVLASDEPGATESLPYLVSDRGEIIVLHSAEDATVSLSELYRRGISVACLSDEIFRVDDALQLLGSSVVRVDRLISIDIAVSAAAGAVELLLQNPRHYLQVVVRVV